MDKKEKFLNKIPVYDKIKILEAIDCLLAGDVALLDITKLKGLENQYRVRIGSYRVKFIKYATFTKIIEVSRRNDNTYS